MPPHELLDPIAGKQGDRGHDPRIVQSHQEISSRLRITSGGNLYDEHLAGTPATIAYGSTFRVTSEPAATIAPWPMVTPESSMAPVPNQTSDPMTMSPRVSGMPSSKAPSKFHWTRKGKSDTHDFGMDSTVDDRTSGAIEQNDPIVIRASLPS